MMVNLSTYLEHSSIAHPDKTALIFDDKYWTFKQINEQASAFAHGLGEIGVGKTDRVTLFLPNCPEFFFCYFGILKTGAVVNPLNTMQKEKELDYLISDCRPSAIVTTQDLSSDLINICKKSPNQDIKLIIIGGKTNENIISYDDFTKDQPVLFNSIAVEKDDLAAILYTSGTTGLPKGVMLTHTNLWTNGRHCADWAETTCRDVGVCALPLFHSYALTHVVAELWMSAGTLVWFSRFDAEACFEAMANYKATAFHGVGTMYYALVNHPQFDEYAKKIDLRYSVTGAAPTPIPILEAWNDKFGCIIDGYGLTEASPVVMVNPLPARGKQKPNSCGLPLAEEIEVAAVASDNNPVPPGEIGELVIRGMNVMKGYWENPGATAKTIVDGWLHTGDLVYFDEEGYCYVVDRIKDMIITGGFNIYPKEIEDFLYTHPSVGEAQVVGVKDNIKGEVAVACIALKPGMDLTQEEIISYCRKNMAAYKSPRKVIFFNELPKTSTGKLQKTELREMIGNNNA